MILLFRVLFSLVARPTVASSPLNRVLWRCAAPAIAVGLALGGCADGGMVFYAPAAMISDGTTFAITVPSGSGAAHISITSPVAWNSTVLILNGSAVNLTSPVADADTVKSLRGYVFRHAARLPSRTQVIIPADAFLNSQGAHYDLRRELPRSLDAFYVTTGGEFVHWRAPIAKIDQ